MDELTGAIQTGRHSGAAIYTFCDGHTQRASYARTFHPPSLNLHRP
jgi:prepilin-type processing-associated H-X9-DG protein